MEVILIIVVFWVVGKTSEKRCSAVLARATTGVTSNTYEATAALSCRFFRVRSRNMIRINQKMNVDK